MRIVTARQGRIIRLLRLHGSVEVSTVAQHLGVSEMTIRRDLAELAAQGLVDRVHGGAVLRPARPRSGHESGSGAESSSALRFVMLTPGLGYYYGQVLRGAEEAAAELGVHLVYAQHNYEASREEQLLARIDGLHADGLILSTRLWPTEMGSALVAQLEQLSVPVVLCERPGHHGFLAELDHVATDHGHGLWLAMRHLHDLGHRRITWVSRDVYDGRLRQALVRRAGESLGMQVNDLTGTHPGHNVPHRDECRSIIALTLAHGSTAMLIHNDQEALTMLPALQAAGVRIPQDMSVISSDDERVAATSTPLTAISPAKAEIGRRCLELLHRRVTRAGQYQPTEHLWLLPRLILRASTMPPAAVRGVADDDPQEQPA